MKALRTLLHLQNHYCQQKSIADLEVVTSIHLFIFRHFAIQLRGEKLLPYFFSPNFLSIKVLINILKFPDYVTSSPLASSSLWIHHPQVSIPGAIVSPGNLRIGGKMKDVTSFKRIFADVYYGSGQNTSVGKGNGSQTSPLASQSGELAMPLKILKYLMARSDLQEPARGLSLVS